MNVGIRCLILGLICAVACQRPTPEPAPAPDAQDLGAAAVKAEGRTDAEGWKERMHYHLEVATELRQAVILADLDNLRALAKRIGDLPPPQGLPEAWTGDFEAIREAGRTTAAAQTPRDAALGAAAIAHACGRCHASQGAKPDFGTPTPPPNRDDLESEMRRYQWAIERMWEATLGGDGDRWQAGAQALQAPSEKKLEDPRALAPEVAATAAAMHAIAEHRQETDPAKRQEQLGVAMTACGTCHAAMGLAKR